jgi:acetyl-CoA C-acetyltransferase
MSQDIVILGGARTAIGTFGGALAGTTAIDLGTAAAKAAMARAGVAADQIGHVVFATCTCRGWPRCRPVCLTACLR